MPTVPTTRNAVCWALKEFGPLSAAELAEVLPLTRAGIDRGITKARAGGRRDYIRIHSWRRQNGTGGREIPVYDLGPGEDAPRPRLGVQARRETWRRYEVAHRAERRIANTLRRGGQANPFKQLVSVWRDTSARST